MWCCEVPGSDHFGCQRDTQEASVHHYFAEVLYRERLARWEREAELQRLLRRAEEPRSKRTGYSLPGLHRRVHPAPDGAC